MRTGGGREEQITPVNWTPNESMLADGSAIKKGRL